MKTKHSLIVGLVALVGLLLGWGLRVDAQGIGFSLLIQSSGTPIGAVVGMNCSTNVTCTISGGIVQVSAAGGGGGSSYTQSFTSQTSVVLTHSLGTTTIVVQCFDNSSPPVEVGFDTLTLTDANNATVTFLTTQSGSCKVIS